MRIETTILKNLLHDEDYARKVVPHLREEYFQDKIERAIASQILKFFIKFSNLGLILYSISLFTI